jgi:hypothetical protein
MGEVSNEMTTLDVETLLEELTLDEKVALTAGMNELCPILCFRCVY